MKIFNTRIEYKENSEFEKELNNLKTMLKIQNNTDLVRYLVMNYKNVVNNLPVHDLRQWYLITYSDNSTCLEMFTEQEIEDFIKQPQYAQFTNEDIKVKSYEKI